MLWWLEVKTKQPYCIYYFGPFDSASEAEQAQEGYLEDLKQEGAQEIEIQIKFYSPNELTIFQD
ncbi:protein of unknown function DUF1816 [Microseira wollei NIES-4236]|uniref:DUF1816 domain-containing protein n=2 Tax=Microseira wollei TaxID=467598 RepID=A0AAV3XF63_9CYAN|nr:protein of unknown function DUF1816 [Microseira wollei NIES-4236]